MKLKVKRTFKGTSYTVGKLYVDDEYLCDTLEPPYKGTSQFDSITSIKNTKKGNTAVPIGTYSINMDIVSPKFKDRSWAVPYEGKLPTIENVPAFDRVLIHVGNKAAQYGKSDTQACILVGRNTIKGGLTESTASFHKLMKVLSKNRKISLIIE